MKPRKENSGEQQVEGKAEGKLKSLKQQMLTRKPLNEEQKKDFLKRIQSQQVLGNYFSASNSKSNDNTLDKRLFQSSVKDSSTSS
mmetsp:Transcript_2672/g.2545  ORF Transcript_2672/g.2545 Transcript_2672/m.2545 type:complete len:85 (+) Transcript_2672:1460-1714(+)|eukprot:CAMPEP_0170542568 /NCGR_PEP_ID=MMETSP0211-20121228/1956_1 /TAXON_ID=311385 /ORGANISM="Pseudokeronopsis sp., Strain OXSARD2" /LENGTH=84 /DNA_ID=CAMNT_0010845673 /DNA_START=1869 /DNA_END=2123 /DNA_ORIENTATION=-